MHTLLLCAYVLGKRFYAHWLGGRAEIEYNALFQGVQMRNKIVLFKRRVPVYVFEKVNRNGFGQKRDVFSQSIVSQQSRFVRVGQHLAYFFKTHKNIVIRNLRTVKRFEKNFFLFPKKTAVATKFSGKGV